MKATGKKYLRTTMVVGLRRRVDGDATSLIFEAAVVPAYAGEKVVVTEDTAGVLNLVCEVLEREGIPLQVPESFATDEDRYAFWRDVLSRVEVVWDHYKYSTGNRVGLDFNMQDGTSLTLFEMDYPRSCQISLERTWILEPQPA